VTAAALAGLAVPEPFPALAVGKAATAMLAGARDALGDALGPAVVVTRRDAVRAGDSLLPGARVLFGDHPVPGPASLRAGAEVVAFCDTLPAGAGLLVLISGGASALLEQLPEGVGAPDLARANRWLLGSGLPIGEVNAVRSGLSMLKAGRLAARLAGRRVLALAVSDVPGDDPAVIGSGPLTPSMAAPLPPGLPDWLGALTDMSGEPPRPGDPNLARVDYRIVGSASMAAQAAASAARGEGIQARVHEPTLTGPVEEAAGRIARALVPGAPGVHVWRGETTVRLPPQPGEGGRNRHLALLLAARLTGRDDVTVLCAATDGSDGSDGAAGGWADGGTLRRGRAAGLDPARCLATADSGTFLAAAGDAFATGPSGTNVMDLAIAAVGPGALRGAARPLGL
jgi:hydroxypyruvate reductase